MQEYSIFLRLPPYSRLTTSYSYTLRHLGVSSKAQWGFPPTWLPGFTEKFCYSPQIVRPLGHPPTLPSPVRHQASDIPLAMQTLLIFHSTHTRRTSVDAARPRCAADISEWISSHRKLAMSKPSCPFPRNPLCRAIVFIIVDETKLTPPTSGWSVCAILYPGRGLWVKNLSGVPGSDHLLLLPHRWPRSLHWLLITTQSQSCKCNHTGDLAG